MNMSEAELERIAELVASVDRKAPTGTFLTPEEITELTGRRAHRLQIETLRAQGVPFFLNAAGKPVVPRHAIEGKPPAAAAKPVRKAWTPPE